MTRSSQPSAAAAAPREVFAPDMPTYAELSRRAFLSVQHESYERSGLPRLHLAAPGDEATNLVVRLRLAQSQIAPAVRQVFIPSKAQAQSLLIEFGDNQPGLLLLSLDPPSGGSASAQVTVMPFTRLADIAQGDHEGVLQIVPPSADIITTTLQLTQLETGDVTYTASNTAVSFASLTPAEIADQVRRLEDRTAARVAAALCEIVFAANPPPPGARMLEAGCTISPRTRAMLICGAHALGTLASGVGGVLLMLAAPTNLALGGAALAAFGGVERGVVATVNAYNAIPEAPPGERTRLLGDDR